MVNEKLGPQWAKKYNPKGGKKSEKGSAVAASSSTSKGSSSSSSSTTTPKSTKKGGGKTAALILPKKVIQKIIKDVKASEFASPFLRPVDLSEAPGYMDVVDEPMDLSSIEKSFKQGLYEGVEGTLLLASHMRLISTNCVAYNDPDSSIAQWSKWLVEAFEELYLTACNEERGGMAVAPDLVPATAAKSTTNTTGSSKSTSKKGTNSSSSGGDDGVNGSGGSGKSAGKAAAGLPSSSSSGKKSSNEKGSDKDKKKRKSVDFQLGEDDEEEGGETGAAMFHDDVDHVKMEEGEDMGVVDKDMDPDTDFHSLKPAAAATAAIKKESAATKKEAAAAKSEANSEAQRAAELKQKTLANLVLPSPPYVNSRADGTPITPHSSQPSSKLLITRSREHRASIGSSLTCEQIVAILSTIDTPTGHMSSHVKGNSPPSFRPCLILPPY